MFKQKKEKIEQVILNPLCSAFEKLYNEMET